MNFSSNVLNGSPAFERFEGKTCLFQGVKRQPVPGNHYEENGCIK